MKIATEEGLIGIAEIVIVIKCVCPRKVAGVINYLLSLPVTVIIEYANNVIAIVFVPIVWFCYLVKGYGQVAQPACRNGKPAPTSIYITPISFCVYYETIGTTIAIACKVCVVSTTNMLKADSVYHLAVTVYYRFIYAIV